MSCSTLVFFFFPLPSSPLHGLLIWDLFKSGTAPQEDFSLLGKGIPAPSLSHYTHTLTYTLALPKMSDSTVNAHLEGIISDFEG